MTRHSVSEFGVRSSELRRSGCRRQIFQAEKTADAVLQMHDQIAFFQIGEINVERGAGGQRVRRFQPARPLDFVTPKNFRVGDDDEFGLVANEAARERADSESAVRRPQSPACRDCRLWTVDCGLSDLFPSRFPQTAAVRRRCCKRRGRRSLAAASGGVD